MKGNVYAKGFCPVCAGRFVFDESRRDYYCPDHLTRPGRYYVQVYNKAAGRAINLSSDPDSRQVLSSYEQAYRLLTAIRREIDKGKKNDFDPTKYVGRMIKPYLFENWSEDWLGKKRAEVDTNKLSPSYLKSLKAHIRHHLQPFFAEIDIRDIDTEAVHDFYLTLRQSPHYTSNILDTLDNMLGDALDWGKIETLPKFPRIEIPEPDIRTIDLDQQDKIIRSIPDTMDRAFILFTAREMVRPSETRALQWEDVDLKHDRVTIRRHFSLNQIRPATKAKQIKHLPLDGEVRETLEGLVRHFSGQFVFWKGKKGKPFSESWARKLWKRVSTTLGVDISLYQGTRHSSATEAVNRVGVDATQEFLHHTSRVMTKRYAKIDVESKRKVLRHGS